MVRQGEKAPEFTLPDQNGNKHSLSDYAGKWMLVYFYPMDDTSGCTAEACSFRDNLPKFQNMGVEIIGISKDPVESHKKFEEKYALPFTLLSDENRQILGLYGVWDEEAQDTNRTSFLVAPDGIVAKVYENVIPEVHAEEVMRDAQSLQGK
jgi:thioredoxin-dependent peroxiredoxin